MVAGGRVPGPAALAKQDAMRYQYATFHGGVEEIPYPGGWSA